MFIYICQAAPCFQFSKKLNNRNSGKIPLVGCGCLLVVYGRLPVVCGRFLMVWYRLLWFVVVLHVVCGGLQSLPLLVTTISENLLYVNY